MNTHRTALALVALSVLSACSSDQHRLDKAREAWAAEGSEAYIMTVTQNCFCPDTDPVDVEVVGSAVRSAVVHSSYGDIELEIADYQVWFTVNGLFDQIQGAINGGAHAVDVEYADKLGYPRSIQIDWEQLSADDEQGWTVEGLKIDLAGQGGT